MGTASNIFLFPAFVQRYVGCEVNALVRHHIDLGRFLREADALVDYDLKAFDIDSNNFLEDELGNQYMTYILSCAIAQIPRQLNIYPHYAAGMSMGLYAALYESGSIDFADGLKLIRDAFYTCKQVLPANMNFGMGYAIGLPAHEVAQCIHDHSLTVEIINFNNENSLLISGKSGDIKKMVEIVQEKGAIKSGVFNISVPYHASFLKETGRLLDSKLRRYHLRSPQCPIVSAIDQRLITTVGQIRHELVSNLNTPFHWLNTIKKIDQLPVNYGVESGPGNSIYRLGKFIDKDFSIVPVNKFDKMLRKEV